MYLVTIFRVFFVTTSSRFFTISIVTVLMTPSLSFHQLSSCHYCVTISSIFSQSHHYLITILSLSSQYLVLSCHNPVTISLLVCDHFIKLSRHCVFPISLLSFRVLISIPQLPIKACHYITLSLTRHYLPTRYRVLSDGYRILRRYLLQHHHHVHRVLLRCILHLQSTLGRMW